MMEMPLISFFYFGALVSSVLLFLKIRTWLRGTIAFAFVVYFAGAFVLNDQALMGGLYDHGTPGEALLFSDFTFCWALVTIGLSFLLARRDASLSLVFPTIYFLASVLIVIGVLMDFQSRYDHYHYFYYYSQIFERENTGP